MNKEKLISAGVNYDEGAARFCGHAEIYEKYLIKFFEDSMMDTLEQQLSKKDVIGAFLTAHDLKGVAGNLSLNAYYKEIYSLTELLRHGKPEDNYFDTFERAKALYRKALSAAVEE